MPSRSDVVQRNRRGFMNCLRLMQAAVDVWSLHLVTTSKAKAAATMPEAAWIHVITMPKVGGPRSAPKYLMNEGAMINRIERTCNVVAVVIIKPCVLNLFLLA